MAWSSASWKSKKVLIKGENNIKPKKNEAQALPLNALEVGQAGGREREHRWCSGVPKHFTERSCRSRGCLSIGIVPRSPWHLPGCVCAELGAGARPGHGGFQKAPIVRGWTRGSQRLCPGWTGGTGLDWWNWARGSWGSSPSPARAALTSPPSVRLECFGLEWLELPIVRVLTVF